MFKGFVNPLRRTIVFSRPVFRVSEMMRPASFRRFQSTFQQQMPPKKKTGGIKALMTEYGFSALGVYLGLSFIDFPICFVVVKSVGEDTIEHYENELFKLIGYGKTEEELQKKKEERDLKSKEQENIDTTDMSFWEKTKNSVSSTLLTQIAIAYGIHKSLIFIRLPITAAITPGIVATLRRWGFNIGKDKLSTTAAIAKDSMKNITRKTVDATASSAKFGTKPDKKQKWFGWLF